ncbi:MAG: gluconokinase [Deltaproteobacteria bacterium]|nr:gluconokinase [Deltaproteobacteria bacterium]
MGVSGAGKTTIGRLLAEQLGATFVEGDDFHPPANVAKMRSGTPLGDHDREPWLEALAQRIAGAEAAHEDLVLACSALRRAYRERLSRAAAEARFVHLDVPQEVLRERLRRRRGHFMPESLLQSQLATLEPPAPDEDALVVDASGTPEKTVAAIRRDLGR